MKKAAMVLVLVLLAGNAMADGGYLIGGGRSDDGGYMGSGGGVLGSGGGAQSVQEDEGIIGSGVGFWAFVLSFFE